MGDNLGKAIQIFKPDQSSNYLEIDDRDVKTNNENVYLTDAFRNTIARTGFGTENLINGTEYTSNRISFNRQLLTNLYRGNWIVKDIIDMIPEDMTKTWFNLSGSYETEEKTAISVYQDKINIKDQIVSGLKWGRLYGTAYGIMLIRSQQDLSLPLDVDAIMPDDFKGLYILDRWSGIEPDFATIITDLTNPDFGKPEFYKIDLTVHGGGFVYVHRSRLIMFKGRDVPITDQLLDHCGDSVLESVYEELVKRDNVSNNMNALTFKALLSVYSVKDLDAGLGIAGGAAARRLYDTIQAQSVLESNMGIRLIDSNSKLEQLQYNFAGLKDMYEAHVQDVAGASFIPMSKLFGRSPSGLNATGKADIQMYNDRLTIERETYLLPILKQLVPVISMSAIGKYPNDTQIHFEPIRNPDETEKANIATKKGAVILDAYMNRLIDKSTALKEFRSMGEDTGMWYSITDKDINDATGVYFGDDSATIDDPIVGMAKSNIKSLLSKEKEPEVTEVGEFSEDL